MKTNQPEKVYLKWDFGIRNQKLSRIGNCAGGLLKGGKNFKEIAKFRL